MKVSMAVVIAFVFHLMTLAACGFSSLLVQTAVFSRSFRVEVYKRESAISGDISDDIIEIEQSDDDDEHEYEDDNPEDNDSESERREHRYEIFLSSDILYFDVKIY